ncbi:MAG: saccharopine dehydrogenase NADP-binding domain-containing protein [Anaeromyxobacteraceae bacterium]
MIRREPAGPTPRTFAVVGGAGAMGRITVRDLVETCAPEDEIVIADHDFAKAEQLAASLAAGKPRVRGVRVDVSDHAGTAKALAGAFCVINAVHYQRNLDVMEAALLAGAHYVDMGGLFHVTRQQLELDARFREAGLTAILGMGAAPGVANLLARQGAEQLDEVREIHIRVGGSDRSRYLDVPALPVSYSLKTILEEFSLAPAVFTKGELRFVQPMTGAKPHRFPPPVGTVVPMYTIHSEVATLPDSYREKGVREVSFKIAFDPDFVEKVRFLRDLGMASHDPISIAGVSVRPIDVANHVAMNQRRARRLGPLRQYEIVRAIVKGTAAERKQTWVVDLHTKGMPAWGIGLDIDTGSPPAVAAQMLAAREITGRGALPPERVVPWKPFFARLKPRGMKVVATKKPGWSFAV